MLSFLIVQLFVYVGCTESYRILMMPINMYSHASCMSSIAAGLVARGHQVHMVFAREFGPLPPDVEANPGITVERYQRPELGMSADIDAFHDNVSRMTLEERKSPAEVFAETSPLFAIECRRLLLHNEPLMTRLVDLNFDLAVVDGLFVLKCLYLVPHRLGVPWVTLTDSFEPFLARVPWLPSFVPHMMFDKFTDRMDFSERLQNFFWTMVGAYVPLVPEPPEEILTKYREYGDFGTMNDLAARSVLWIITSDFIIDYARPMMPNVIEAGGLTTTPSTKKLPENVESFIERPSKGTILVSFGSAVSHFPAEIVGNFVSAFARLQDYNIIWRFENKNGVALSGNVLAQKWIPQNEILAHPKTRLFITHCGNNGQYEAMYHGVPMIGFPVGGDQPYNAKRLVARGYGLTMNIHEFSSGELLSNIQKILSDGSFKDRISKASEIYKSAPMSAREKSAWWVEHVTRFGGGHLGSAGNDLALHEYLMLDVVVFLLVLVLAFAFVAWKIVRFLLKKLTFAIRSATGQKTKTS